jgi:hypothetical protein
MLSVLRSETTQSAIARRPHMSRTTFANWPRQFLNAGAEDDRLFELRPCRLCPICFSTEVTPRLAQTVEQ